MTDGKKPARLSRVALCGCSGLSLECLQSAAHEGKLRQSLAESLSRGDRSASPVRLRQPEAMGKSRRENPELHKGSLAYLHRVPRKY